MLFYWRREVVQIIKYQGVNNCGICGFVKNNFLMRDFISQNEFTSITGWDFCHCFSVKYKKNLNLVNYLKQSIVTSEIRNQMQTRMDAEIVVLIGTESEASISEVQSTESSGKDSQEIKTSNQNGRQNRHGLGRNENH